MKAVGNTKDDCETCKFISLGLHSAPCFYCFDFAEWEPQVCNEVRKPWRHDL